MFLVAGRTLLIPHEALLSRRRCALHGMCSRAASRITLASHTHLHMHGDSMCVAYALLTRNKRRSRLHAAVARCMACAHGFVSNHACVTHLSSCTCSQVVSPAWLVSVTRPVQYFCALDISGLGWSLECEEAYRLAAFRPALDLGGDVIAIMCHE